MTKTDKKTDKSVRLALTAVCEIALHEVVGFKWLTHFANYRQFPDSLSIVCVFDTDANLSSALSNHKDDYIVSLIEEKLISPAISIENMRQHVSFDSEEACALENAGKWAERFRQH